MNCLRRLRLITILVEEEKVGKGLGRKSGGRKSG